MADETIKTQVMKALGTLFSQIQELKTIQRYKGRPIDLDIAPCPALVFWDDNEERQRENQAQNGVVDLIITVYFKVEPTESAEEAFTDEADFIQGKIHNQFFGTTNLVGLVKMVQEGTVKKEYPNDVFRVLVMQYTIVYGHAFGNAFQTR